MNEFEPGDCVFEFNDGRQSLNRINLRISTASMEVIINHLLKHNTEQGSKLYIESTEENR